MTNNQKHIFMIEDSVDIQILLSRFLRGEGYSISYANNGREGLEKLLNSSEELPSVILLDLMMPEMDGFEFRREQQKHAKIAGIPVIVMTADNDIRAKANQLKANAFLKKPFTDVEAILETVGHFFPG